MDNIRFLIIGIIFTLTITSCSKKHLPTTDKKATVEYESDNTKNSEPEHSTPIVKKPVAKQAESFPKIISVNDAAATKAVDGRMYYDIKGKRYWKNFKDGKYYLFDKSMYSNPDFKPGGDE